MCNDWEIALFYAQQCSKFHRYCKLALADGVSRMGCLEGRLSTTSISAWSQRDFTGYAMHSTLFSSDGDEEGIYLKRFSVGNYVFVFVFVF